MFTADNTHAQLTDQTNVLDKLPIATHFYRSGEAGKQGSITKRLQIRPCMGQWNNGWFRIAELNNASYRTHNTQQAREKLTTRIFVPDQARNDIVKCGLTQPLRCFKQQWNSAGQHDLVCRPYI